MSVYSFNFEVSRGRIRNFEVSRGRIRILALRCPEVGLDSPFEFRFVLILRVPTSEQDLFCS